MTARTRLPGGHRGAAGSGGTAPRGGAAPQMTARPRLPGGHRGAAGSGGTAPRGAPAAAAWLGATGLGASALLRLSFTSPAGSRHFYLLTSGLAGTLAAGALGAGPVRWYGGDWRGRPVSA